MNGRRWLQGGEVRSIFFTAPCVWSGSCSNRNPTRSPRVRPSHDPRIHIRLPSNVAGDKGARSRTCHVLIAGTVRFLLELRNGFRERILRNDSPTSDLSYLSRLLTDCSNPLQSYPGHSLLVLCQSFIQPLPCRGVVRTVMRWISSLTNVTEVDTREVPERAWRRRR